MLKFLPTEIFYAIKNVNINFLYEIRIRAGKPIMIRYGEGYVYLSKYGATNCREEALIASKEDIDEALLIAGKYSIYSIEDQLRQGFLTTERGVRIGVSGHYVSEKKEIITVRDFTSLCIRIPHDVFDCSEEIYRRFLSDGLINLLIASKPGQGKTTIVRDLSRKLSEKSLKNVLICDERGEIAEGDLGDRVDVFAFANKCVALGLGIRVMAPDVVVVDELSVAELPYITQAKNSGVHLIATIHAGKITDIPDEVRREFDVIVLLDFEKIGRVLDFSYEKLNG